MSSEQKLASLLSAALLAAPIAVPAQTAAAESSLSISPPKTVSLRASHRKMTHLLAAAPRLLPKGSYVGELQERWQFPSDHLPIGMTIDGLNIASWNVLDGDYMSWVTEKNSQGLSRSMIADEHVYIGDSKLTIRDRHIADLILQMTSHPTHPRSLLALQECNSPFIEELRARLPDYFEIVSHYGEAIVFDSRLFEMKDTNAKPVSGIFSEQPERTFQDIILRRRDTGKEVRLINAHLPGAPDKPARFEFAQYLLDTFDASTTTLAMGDMNFNELEMSDALEKAAGPSSPFALYTPYCTNISPYTFISKAIDHFMVYSPESKGDVELSLPEEVMPGLNQTVDLLN